MRHVHLSIFLSFVECILLIAPPPDSLAPHCRHGAALVRALQELGSSSQIVYVVERLSKLGFEGASGDVVLESLVAELGKR